MPELKRTLSLPLITFFGLGSILGAGIYVLLGAVSREAGYCLPAAFFFASVIAGVTAFSYAELVARMPKSGGEAVYVDVAFKQRWLTLMVGYGAVATGVISAATIASGFVGYFALFVSLNDYFVIAAVVLTLGTIAAVGISASAWTATTMTLIEIGGLMLIIVLAGDDLAGWELSNYQRVMPSEKTQWLGVGAGAFLAFFAFLGFEDMVNVAEEVRDPSRNMPRAILLALVAATVLYLLITFAALASVPVDVLAISTAPLATIADAQGVPTRLMAAVAMVAITNGALIQMIKSSRILYGMAKLGDAPAPLQEISATTKTPLVATCCVVGLVLLMALCFPTIELASLTSLMTLSIFAIVNGALWRLKRTSPQPTGVINCPVFVPVIGMALCLSLIALQAI